MTMGASLPRLPRPAPHNGNGLYLATVVGNLHSLDPRKQARDAVVINHFYEKLHIGEHDPGGAADNNVDIFSIVLPGLDRTALELTPQTIGLGDKAASVDARKVGEGNLPCLSLAGEYLAALIGTCGPSPARSNAIALPGNANTDGTSVTASTQDIRRLIFICPWKPSTVPSRCQ